MPGNGARPSRRDLLALRPHRLPGPTTAENHWLLVFRRAMACRFEIALEGPDARHVAAARRALHEADRLEGSLSWFRETSALSLMNRRAASAPVPVDEELFDLLLACHALHRETDGAFDITATPLSRCWGFLARRPAVPTEADLGEARGRVGQSRVRLDADRRTVRFDREGVELNLGSIGKGFAVGRIGASLLDEGVSHALVSAAGSSALAIGGLGRGWPVRITSPLADRPLARLWLRDGALGTSGAGEQFVEADGRRFGHVLDPRTGWPARGVLSATVVTGDAARADALSTAFFIGGADLARRYCDRHPQTLALVTPDVPNARPELIGAYDGAIVEVP